MSTRAGLDFGAALYKLKTIAIIALYTYISDTFIFKTVYIQAPIAHICLSHDNKKGATRAPFLWVYKLNYSFHFWKLNYSFHFSINFSGERLS